MHKLVKPNDWVVLRLPSDTLKALQVIPNMYDVQPFKLKLWMPTCTDFLCRQISIGKYGTFPSNLIIDRPYNLTYELLDKQQGHKYSDLRIVPASELHADTIAEENAASKPSTDDKVIIGEDGVEFELVGENGEVIMRSNRETIDDSARQTLTMEEIETLKRDGASAGKDLIAKLMLSHTALDQKTAFSLAKYKLLKTKKYLRRFTVLPLDVPMMNHWMIEEKNASKILEIREEMLALAGSWSNVHFAEDPEYENAAALDTRGGGRWLVVDETGGLLVAAMAERMGILYPEDDEDHPEKPQTQEEPVQQNPSQETEQPQGEQPVVTLPKQKNTEGRNRPYASTNTITLIHANSQPNLSLLKYFNFNADNPPKSHPLTKHLLPISWLQLIDPERDALYSSEPPTASPEELAEWNSGKKGTHFRKKRRWERIRHIVSATRHGDFTGLAIASNMDLTSVLRQTVPLLRPGASVSIYSPTVEPLVALADLYSTSRRTAFIQSPPAELEGMTQAEMATWQGNEDFPLNPTLLLNSAVQTCKLRQWQVLPGRTHPLMTGRGGAEGYLFTATRVIPAEGKVEAKGKFARKRKGVEGEDATSKRAIADDSVDSAAKKVKLDMEVTHAIPNGKEDVDMAV
ncbi:hypothetical protein CJF31_00008043 [Rutstroemia sp. NJR-2017a BVV2]|nr:hypothetical protein CJF31_00008043 [Rutstroemia sp. NJR-2017a BVV2]